MKIKMINQVLVPGMLATLQVLVVLLPKVQAEGLRASYLENSNGRSVLELVLDDPAPSSVIVRQRIPEGSRVLDVSPDYSKYVSKTHELKWLFKGPRPGITRIVVSFTIPPSGKGLSAVIRCKDPRDGTLMTLRLP